jgi:hypothetical protein
VSSKWTSGDFQGAMEYSDKAKKWALASTICGAVSIVLVIIIEIVAFNILKNSQTTP